MGNRYTTTNVDLTQSLLSDHDQTKVWKSVYFRDSTRKTQMANTARASMFPGRSKAYVDEFVEAKYLVAASSVLKRAPEDRLTIVDRTRGLRSNKDSRKVWGVLPGGDATHSSMTCVVEARWDAEPDVVVLGSGFLIGDVNDNQSVVSISTSGYAKIRSCWVLTAGHCIYHEEHGLCTHVRIRMPKPDVYHMHRAILPMETHKDDPKRPRRFKDVWGKATVFPGYAKNPDPFAGENIGLIKLNTTMTRPGLKLKVVPFDWKPSVLTVGGYPGQVEKCYHLLVSTGRYKRLSNNEIVDTKYRFDRIEEKGEGKGLIYYTNQVTAGQAGGPVSGYTDDRPGSIIGVHSNEGMDELNSGTLLTQEILDWVAEIQDEVKKHESRKASENSNRSSRGAYTYNTRLK